MRTSFTTKTDIHLSSVVRSIYKSSYDNIVRPHNTMQSVAFVKGNEVNGTRDADWQVLAEKRQDASGAYLRRAIKVMPKKTDLTCLYKIKALGTWVDASGSVIYLADPLPHVQEQDDFALKDLALARLKNKLSSRSNQVNLIVPIVELRELRDLVKAITFSATDLFMALIKIKKSKGKSAFQFAAHATLNFNFAVAPMVSELKEIGDAIAQYMDESDSSAFTDYGASKKSWFSYVNGSASTLYGCTSATKLQLAHSLSYRYVAGYKTPMRSANDYSALNDFGFEIGALVPTLWELMAFSWLVDYVSTVGAVLEDTFVTDTTETFYVNCTKRYTCKGFWTLEKPVGSTISTGTSSLLSSTFNWDFTERSVLPKLPARSLRFKTVDEIAKNGMTKLANLGSILIGGRAFSNKF